MTPLELMMQIKCKAEEVNGHVNPLDPTCEGCKKLGMECTYEYVRKKPGRKNGSVPLFPRDYAKRSGGGADDSGIY
jgi:hypothetical protein